MENNTEKKIVDEKLNVVVGGNGFESDIPAGWTSTSVTDDGHGCVKCPHDGNVLDYPRCAVPEGFWCEYVYHCQKCGKWFVKTGLGQWYESENKPAGVIFI